MRRCYKLVWGINKEGLGRWHPLVWCLRTVSWHKRWQISHLHTWESQVITPVMSNAYFPADCICNKCIGDNRMCCVPKYSPKVPQLPAILTLAPASAPKNSLSSSSGKLVSTSKKSSLSSSGNEPKKQGTIPDHFPTQAK